MPRLTFIGWVAALAAVTHLICLALSLLDHKTGGAVFHLLFVALCLSFALAQTKDD